MKKEMLQNNIEPIITQLQAVEYELASKPIYSYINWGWLQNLIANKIANKVRKKYPKYIAYKAAQSDLLLSKLKKSKKEN